MLHYIQPELLREVCDVEKHYLNLGSMLVEVLATVLDNDDEDGHLIVLQIIQDLMQKSPDLFLDHFARLGVFNKVLQLAGPEEEEEEEEAAAAAKSKEQNKVRDE